MQSNNEKNVELPPPGRIINIPSVAPMADVNDGPINMTLKGIYAEFANSVKTIEMCDGEKVVMGFDATTLRLKCSPSSPQFVHELDMDSLCLALFPPNEWWANRNMLVNAVKDFGYVYGFKANSPKQCIRCSREGATTTKRNYISGSL